MNDFIPPLVGVFLLSFVIIGCLGLLFTSAQLVTGDCGTDCDCWHAKAVRFSNVYNAQMEQNCLLKKQMVAQS